MSHQYTVPKGVAGKLVKLEKNKDAEVSDWSTRKELVFTECLIDPVVVKTMTRPSKLPLAIKMADEGFALFGGASGGDRNSLYVLAVPYSQIKYVEV